MRIALTLCLLSFAFAVKAAPVVSLLGRVQLRGSAQLRSAGVESFTANMIACWPLDEAVGTREDDFASFDLTDNNTVTGTTGPSGLGNASSFDSANSEFLSHADHASLRMGDFDTTWAIWFNCTTDNAQLQSMISKTGLTLNLGHKLYRDSADDKIKFVVHDSGNNPVTVSSTATFAPGSGWHFVVCGYDKANTRIFLYVDNGAANTAAMAAAPNGATAGATFRIGDTISSQYWDGGLAGAALWGRLLTAGERTALWAGGNGARACEEEGN